MDVMIERRVCMPNGRRESDHYSAKWCKERHDKIDRRLNEITGPTGHLRQVHDRIDHIWYLLMAVGVVGVANLIATLIYT